MLSAYLRKISKWLLLISLASGLSSAPCYAQLRAEEEIAVKVFEQTSPSVVCIKNAYLQWDWFSDHFQESPSGAGARGLLCNLENIRCRFRDFAIITKI